MSNILASGSNSIKIWDTGILILYLIFINNIMLFSNWTMFENSYHFRNQIHLDY